MLQLEEVATAHLQVLRDCPIEASALSTVFFMSARVIHQKSKERTDDGSSLVVQGVKDGNISRLGKTSIQNMRKVRDRAHGFVRRLVFEPARLALRDIALLRRQVHLQR